MQIVILTCRIPGVCLRRLLIGGWVMAVKLTWNDRWLLKTANYKVSSGEMEANGLM